MTVGIVNVAESMELAQNMGGYPLVDDFLPALLCLSTLNVYKLYKSHLMEFQEFSLLYNFYYYLLQMMLLCYLKFMEAN